MRSRAAGGGMVKRVFDENTIQSYFHRELQKSQYFPIDGYEKTIDDNAHIIV